MSARLKIINAMLRITGEYATDSTLENHPDVVTCSAILDEIRAEELSEGWWYNTSITTLFRTTAGKILISSNVMALDAVDEDLEVSIRDGYLYDNKNETFIFTQDVRAQMVRDLDEDDIPPIPRSVIKWKCVLAYAAAEQVTGEPIKQAMNSLEVAQIRLTAERLRKANSNFNNTPMMQRMNLFKGAGARFGRAGVYSKLRKT